MELEQGVSLALGLTIDPEGDVVILVVIGTEDQQVAVPITPDVSLHFSRSMRDMAREAQKLQDELVDLDPEEIKDRMVAIQQRYTAQAS